MAKEMNSPTKIAQLSKELANINALIENHEKLVEKHIFKFFNPLFYLQDQLKIDDDKHFRRSDMEAINDDFFDMIDRMQAKRIEDQRAEFPSSIQIDNRDFGELTSLKASTT